MNALFAELDAYAAAFVAALLIASAGHKLIDRERLARSVGPLTGLNDRMAGPALAAAAAVELAAGLAAAAPATRTLGCLAAALLWCAYLGLMLRAIAAGRADIDCGCSFGRGHAPLGRVQVRRNLGLIAIALAAGAGARFGTAAIGPLQILAGLAFLVLYAAFDQVALLSPRAIGR